MLAQAASTAAGAPGRPQATLAAPAADREGTLAAGDEACRAALELSYGGSTSLALARLAELNARQPREPLCRYVELLVRAWILEQAPHDPQLDADFHGRSEQLVRLADQLLERNPADARARFARGAAHGISSRLHLYRVEKGAAMRSAVNMREDLQRVPVNDALHAEALFGLGLYDYYADVLPRLLKLLRFLARIPGGDRVRGLAALEAAEQRALWHRTEAEVQLCDIYVYYEDRMDDALSRLRALRQRYPAAPLWGLRLANHLRERLGLFRESAAVARELVSAAEAQQANHAPVVGLMARVIWAEALLDDLQPGDARRVIEPALAGSAEAPWVAARAHLVTGLCLELEGNRGAALVHYRAALSGGGAELRRRALRALEAPLPPEQVRARPLLADGRRWREMQHSREANAAFRAALAVWPYSQEARLRVAEEDLEAGLVTVADGHLARLSGRDQPEPVWVAPWTKLLRARLHDMRGERAAALSLYNQVFQKPYGSTHLRDLARAGREHPYRPSAAGWPTPASGNHPR